MTDDAPTRLDAADFEREQHRTQRLGTLAERKAEELSRFERAIESEIVDAQHRSLSAVEMAAILRDYTDGLECDGRVPAGWRNER